MAGTLYVVATPIGNLEDITVRALRILREVALIAAEDTRRTAHLLTHYGITTPTTSLHEHNEHRKSSTLLSQLENGRSIALVSDAGTPTVSDPGSQLIAEAIARGVRVEPIPGPNAAIAALSVSGIAADGFEFLGFPPTRSKARTKWLERLSQCQGLAVFYEAPHRLLTTLSDIQSRIGDVRVILARELTKVHEQLVRGPISQILADNIPVRGEFTVIVYIGHKPENNSNEHQNGGGLSGLIHEFGQMTSNTTITKRRAIAALAKKYGISTREAYTAIEATKRSGV